MEVEDENEQHLTIPVEIRLPESGVVVHTNLGTSEEDVTTYSRLASEFKLNTEKYLGEGVFGVVTSCQHRLDQKFYAIKKVPIKAVNDSEFQKIMREAVILSKFDSHLIARYHTVWIEATLVGKGPEGYTEIPTTGPFLYIQQHLCDRTLEQEMEDRQLTLEKCATIFLAITEGLKHIHGQKVTHGDIGAANTFHSNGQWKIGDFGRARISDELDAKEDVHELGLLLFDMLQNIATGQMDARLDLDPNDSQDPGSDLKLPDNWPDDSLKRWVMRMIRENVSKRPSARRIWKNREAIKEGILNFRLVDA